MYFGRKHVETIPSCSHEVIEKYSLPIKLILMTEILPIHVYVH